MGFSHIGSICFVLLDDNGGGIRAVTSMIASAVNTNSTLDVKLVVLRRSSGWLTSLNLNIELVLLDSPGPSQDFFHLLNWLYLEKPSHILLNGCWSIHEYLPVITKFTLVTLVVHDILWSSVKPALACHEILYSIVAVSQVVYTTISAHSRSHSLRSKIRLINNGIFPGNLPIRKDIQSSLSISYLGGSVQSKGAFFLQRMLPVLCSRFNHPITLYWAGSDIPNRILKVLDSLPSLEVVNLGLINHLEVESLLAKSSVLLAPSYRESFGMVILEAIKCGCIPIVWDLPGGPQQILSSDCLFKDISLVPPFNLQAYCTKIIQAHECIEDLSYQSQRLLQPFTIDVASRKYIKLIHDSFPDFFDFPSLTLSLPHSHAYPPRKYFSYLPLARYVFKQLMIFCESFSPRLYYRLHLLFYVRLWSVTI